MENLTKDTNRSLNNQRVTENDAARNQRDPNAFQNETSALSTVPESLDDQGLKPASALP